MSTSRGPSESDGQTRLTQQTSYYRTSEILSTSTLSVYETSTLSTSLPLTERSNTLSTGLASSPVESRGLTRTETQTIILPPQSSYKSLGTLSTSVSSSATLSTSILSSGILPTSISSIETISPRQTTLGDEQNFSKPSKTIAMVSEQPVSPSEDAAEGGIRTELIAAIVLAILAFVVLVGVTFIIAAFIFKKRRKSRSFDVNQNQMELTFTNQLYGNQNNNYEFLH